MSTHLIIEGNAVYEIDDDCQACSNNGEKAEAVSDSGMRDRQEKRNENGSGQ